MTGDADLEGIEPRNSHCWCWPMAFISPQATSCVAPMASGVRHPGVLDHFELYIVMASQPGRSTCRPPLAAAPCLKSKQREVGFGAWKSEVPILALKPRNWGGVKGDRQRMAEQGTMGWTQGQVNP